MIAGSCHGMYKHSSVVCSRKLENKLMLIDGNLSCQCLPDKYIKIHDNNNSVSLRISA